MKTYKHRETLTAVLLTNEVVQDWTDNHTTPKGLCVVSWDKNAQGQVTRFSVLCDQGPYEPGKRAYAGTWVVRSSVTGKWIPYTQDVFDTKFELAEY